jgi:cytochrome c-type biogenesis protein CcmE
MGIIPAIHGKQNPSPWRFTPLTYLTCLATFVLSLSLASLSGAGLLEMAELIAHPDHYDKQAVIVFGTVTQVQAVTDREGLPAFRFLLEDRSGTVKVTTPTAVHEGDHVIVEGVFSRRRQGGRMTVYNEVKAHSVRPLNGLNPDLVG